MKSKIDGENATLWSEKWCDPPPQKHQNFTLFWLKLGDLKKKKKKKVFTKILMIFPVGIKKKVFRLHMLFLSVILMDPSRAQGPFAGPAEANSLFEA